MVEPTVELLMQTPSDGIDTSLWGPPLWTALHTAAQSTTTESQRLVWIDLLTAMRTALPCPECTYHYIAWFDAHPVTPTLPPSGTDLRDGISSWILALHNDVNRRNDPPLAEWTLEQVANTYTDTAAARAAVESLRTYISASFLDLFGYLL